VVNGCVGSSLRCVGAALTDRPPLRHLDLGPVLELGHRRVDVVLAGRHDLLQLAFELRRHQHPVDDGLALGSGADDVAANDLLPCGGDRSEVPQLLAVQRRGDGTALDVVAALGNDGQRTLHAVVDRGEQPRSQLDEERTFGRFDRVADLQTGGVLVDLDRRAVALEPDDLTHQALVSDAHDVIHLGPGHARCDGHRSGDFRDSPCNHQPRLSVMSNPIALLIRRARYARWSSPIDSCSLIGSEMTIGR
jgi:hypothetical protein